MSKCKVKNCPVCHNEKREGSYSDTCDVCGSHENVVAGRWIFYCPEHKQVDIDKTYENEITPDLESGNFDYIANDGELQEILLENS